MNEILIRKAKKGDKDAFCRLIDENVQSMYKVAAAYLKNDEDVADAIQDTRWQQRKYRPQPSGSGQTEAGVYAPNPPASTYGRTPAHQGRQSSFQWSEEHLSPCGYSGTAAWEFPVPLPASIGRGMFSVF